MSQPVAGPIYYRIAADLAARIVRGDIREGERLSGRSMLVGSYGVSSETIRRALNLLSEQGIVEVVPGSGVRVISRQKAMAYVERVGMVTDLRSLRREVTDILEEQNDLNRRMQELVDKIFDLSERLKNREPIRATTLAAQTSPFGQHPGGAANAPKNRRHSDCHQAGRAAYCLAGAQAGLFGGGCAGYRRRLRGHPPV